MSEKSPLFFCCHLKFSLGIWAQFVAALWQTSWFCLYNVIKLFCPIFFFHQHMLSVIGVYVTQACWRVKILGDFTVCAMIRLKLWTLKRNEIYKSLFAWTVKGWTRGMTQIRHKPEKQTCTLSSVYKCLNHWSWINQRKGWECEMFTNQHFLILFVHQDATSDSS